MTRVRNATTSLPIHGRSSSLSKISAYNIKPVTPPEGRIIYHYQDVIQKPFEFEKTIYNDLLERLLSERDKAKKSLDNDTKDLAHQITSLVKQYNSLVEILVKIEAVEGYQIDQALQHFLVFHRHAFSAYGITIRQFLYLEYDPILLKSKLAIEGYKKSRAYFFSNKGLIVELFYLFDRLVTGLDNQSTNVHYGHMLDIKA